MRRKKQYIGGILGLIVVLIASVYSIYKDDITSYLEKDEDVKQRVKEVVNIEDTSFQITYLDVGQADSILIKDNDQYMLIDAGNNEDGEKLVNYFKSLGITKFSTVIGTHAHEDHIGGMDDIINNFDIDNFYMPDAITTTRTFEDVLDSLEKKQIAFLVPEVDKTYNLSDSSYTVLYTGENTSDLNNTSIVLKLVYGNVKFLFMGDATSTTEKTILDKDLESDVLKVGHHGSKYSSNEEFLDKVNPKYAIISAGKNNSYDHPNQVTLDKLNNREIKIYRTDEVGSIIIKSDKENVSVNTEHTDTNG